MDEPAETNDPLVEVRATVHLRGLPPGATALVDPSDPYIADLLDADFLVPVGGEVAAAEEDDGDGSEASDES